MLARILLEAAGGTISFVFLILFFHFVGLLKLPEDILEIAAGWLMLAWFGSSLALVPWRLVGDLRSWSKSCGTRCPISSSRCRARRSWSTPLPKQAQDIVLFLPMVHGVEYLREGYFGSR